MPKSNQEIDRSLAAGMIEVLGENSRLVGQTLETVKTLAEKIVDLPTRKMFTILAVAGGFGIMVSTIVAIAALVVAVKS